VDGGGVEVFGGGEIEEVPRRTEGGPSVPSFVRAGGMTSGIEARKAKDDDKQAQKPGAAIYEGARGSWVRFFAVLRMTA